MGFGGGWARGWRQGLGTTSLGSASGLANDGTLDISGTTSSLGSTITAWSPLAQGKIADDAVINEIGKAHGKSAGQVTLRWLIQQNVIAIPRTTKESRARENFDIFDFELTSEEMQRMDALDRAERLGDWLDPAYRWDDPEA